MFHLFLWGLLWIWDLILQPPASKLSEVRLAAEESFKNNDYLKAAEYYKILAEASLFSDPATRLNMANAYLLAGETDEAYKHFQLVSRVTDPQLAARAIARMGLIALEKKDTLTALNKLRKAILIDQNNLYAVADYEILRFRYSGKIDEEVQVPDQESPHVDTLPEPGQLKGDLVAQNNAVVELSDEREQLLQNLDRINMSEEQAKSVLDAMKVNERQYIYQLRLLGAPKTDRSKVEW